MLARNVLAHAKSVQDLAKLNAQIVNLILCWSMVDASAILDTTLDQIIHVFYVINPADNALVLVQMNAWLALKMEYSQYLLKIVQLECAYVLKDKV